MQCPNHDGQLTSHTVQGEKNLTVHYATCERCKSYWMDSFSANYITQPSLPKGEDASYPQHTPYSCPVCDKQLTRAQSDSIPDAVWVFCCPDAHGYFFPTGQLTVFKQAQKAKIDYHALWNIPLISVASVLLTGIFAFAIISQKPGPTTSQAKDILSHHAVMFSTGKTSAIFSATTSSNAQVILHIPGLSLFAVQMKSADGRTHLFTVDHIPPGTYTYSFSVRINDKEVFTSTEDHFSIGE